MIFVGLSTSACFIKEEPEASTKVLEAIPTDRFIIIETTQIGYDNVDVFVDTQTNIEYALVNKSINGYHSASGLSMLTNPDGTPLLYKTIIESENNMKLIIKIRFQSKSKNQAFTCQLRSCMATPTVIPLKFGPFLDNEQDALINLIKLIEKQQESELTNNPEDTFDLVPGLYQWFEADCFTTPKKNLAIMAKNFIQKMLLQLKILMKSLDEQVFIGRPTPMGMVIRHHLIHFVSPMLTQTRLNILSKSKTKKALAKTDALFWQASACGVKFEKIWKPEWQYGC